MHRRTFLKNSSLTFLGLPFLSCKRREQRPNILWITCEDLSPHLGCYGDEYAVTPNLDQLARDGIRYQNAYATAPLCTPARSSLITGVFASTLGTQHLRGVMPLTPDFRCFTEYLREAGYYCSNNVKEDYNFATPETAWDESSDTAHWRKRPAGTPFFSVFNFIETHQGRTRYGKDKLEEINKDLDTKIRRDPAKAPLPPYYPDTPGVRTNMAAFYTQIHLMDKKAGEILQQLEQDGLAQDTIVFFYGDHGNGLPRGKRWLHDTGIRVPLIIRFPKKFRSFAPSAPGSTDDRLVSFVDFGPTVLSLTGLPVPPRVHGRPFLGRQKTAPRDHIVAIRDRVDEVLEMSRTLRDKKFQYIRNFMPHRPRMQRSFYSERTPIRQEIRRLHAADKLKGHEAWLMAASKPLEELYDTDADPYELNNLADLPQYSEQRVTMQKKLYRWMLDTRDTSLLPEPELVERSKGGSPYDMAKDKNRYPIDRILQVADLVGRGASELDKLTAALSDPDSAVRYWAATGCAALKEKALPAGPDLLEALSDPAPCVRIAAAEALCYLDKKKTALPVLGNELTTGNVYVQMYAAIALVAIGQKSRAAAPYMRKAIEQLEGTRDHGWYIREALGHMLEKWG